MPGKMIFAVSLESDNKFRAAAFFDEGHLAITHCDELVGPPRKWRPDLLEELRDKNEKGYVVLVEDRTGSASPYATSFNFDDVDVDGRTTLQHCLDWYFSLWNAGNLSIDPKILRYAIKFGGEGGLIDRQHDEKGRLMYRIDWNTFGGGRKAVLMCVAAAMMEEPFSDRWMKAMTEANRIPAQQMVSPLSSFIAVTLGATMNEAARLDKEQRERTAQALRECGRGSHVH